MGVISALSRITATAPRPVVLAGAFAFLLVSGALGCRERPGKDAMVPVPRPIAAVLADHTPELMAIPGVVGTAESRMPDGRPCILVLLANDSAELRARLPRELEGWPVLPEVTGELRAMPDSGQ